MKSFEMYGALDLYYGKYLIVVLIVGDGQGFVFMRDVEL